MTRTHKYNSPTLKEIHAHSIFFRRTLHCGLRSSPRPGPDRPSGRSAEGHVLPPGGDEDSLLVRAHPSRRRGSTRSSASSTARSAFYFVTEEGVQYLTEPTATEFTKRGTTLDARYETTDNRLASVDIEPQAEGSWRVSVIFSSERGIQRVGEVLSARPGEHFHGLTERVRGNNDGVPRDPSVAVALDRRGERVKMDLNGADFSPG